MDFASLAIGLILGAALYGVLAEIQDRLERRRSLRLGPVEDRATALRLCQAQLVDGLRRGAVEPPVRALPRDVAGMGPAGHLDGYHVTPEAVHIGVEAARRERFTRDLAARNLEIDELSITER
jgi:hypothetical protein